MNQVMFTFYRPISIYKKIYLFHFVIHWKIVHVWNSSNNQIAHNVLSRYWLTKYLFNKLSYMSLQLRHIRGRDVCIWPRFPNVLHNLFVNVARCLYESHWIRISWRTGRKRMYRMWANAQQLYTRRIYYTNRW